MALAALSLLGGRTTAQEPACKPPLMGWSSWNAYRVNISEDIIKHQAELMEEKGLSSEQAQIEAFYANAGRK